MTDSGDKLTVSHAPTGPVVAARPAAASPGPAELSITDPAGLVGSERLALLTRHAARAMAALGVPGDVRVCLVGDGEMSRAHARYMNDPSTTDVLTFDMAEGASAPVGTGDGTGQGAPLDVDILICVEEARRQAASRGHELERELLLYVVHGVLHCLGFDDVTEAESARMHAEEDRILAAIGVGVTYARPEFVAIEPKEEAR